MLCDGEGERNHSESNISLRHSVWPDSSFAALVTGREKRDEKIFRMVHQPLHLFHSGFYESEIQAIIAPNKRPLLLMESRGERR